MLGYIPNMYVNSGLKQQWEEGRQERRREDGGGIVCHNTPKGAE